MRQVILIILIAFFTYSCYNNSNKNESPDPNSDKIVKEPNSKITKDTVNNSNVFEKGLSDALHQAAKAFPKDSASLFSFYNRLNPERDENKLKRYIKRLEALTTEESIEKYYKVENNLLPLSEKIMKNDSVSKLQVDSLVTLYLYFDHFSLEALFTQLKSLENLTLIWKSIGVIAKESYKDTCYISALIYLNNTELTGGEFGEIMDEIVVEAIKNYPTGFLELYNSKQGVSRANFANNIINYGEPDKKIIEMYTDISKNSENENYRKLAMEVLQKFKN